MAEIRFTTAQICLNGHVVTAYADGNLQRRRKFCPKCGEPTITNCPDTTCGAKINGKETYDFSRVVEDLDAPGYCHNCGKPYPWTTRRAEAIAAAIDELDKLPPEEREKLKQSIPDAIKETPRSEIAARRFRKAIESVGPIDGKMLSEIVKKSASEEFLKHLS
jgi:hypothetical protein